MSRSAKILIVAMMGLLGVLSVLWEDDARRSRRPKRQVRVPEPALVDWRPKARPVEKPAVISESRKGGARNRR